MKPLRQRVDELESKLAAQSGEVEKLTHEGTARKEVMRRLEKQLIVSLDAVPALYGIAWSHGLSFCCRDNQQHQQAEVRSEQLCENLSRRRQSNARLQSDLSYVKEELSVASLGQSGTAKLRMELDAANVKLQQANDDLYNSRMAVRTGEVAALPASGNRHTLSSCFLPCTLVGPR